MKNFDWFNLSLVWKTWTIIVAIVFILMAIILFSMRFPIIKIIIVEIGIITAWLVFMVLYGTLIYFIRNKRQS